MAEKIVIDSKTYVKEPYQKLYSKETIAGVLSVSRFRKDTLGVDLRFTEPKGSYDTVQEFEKIVLGTSLLLRTEQDWIIREFFSLYTEEKTV